MGIVTLALNHKDDIRELLVVECHLVIKCKCCRRSSCAISTNQNQKPRRGGGEVLTVYSKDMFGPSCDLSDGLTAQSSDLFGHQ